MNQIFPSPQLGGGRGKQAEITTQSPNHEITKFMKAIKTLLIAAAALLPLTGCAGPAATPAALPPMPTPMSGAPQNDRAHYYTPASAAMVQQLQHALANATRLELTRRHLLRQRETESLTLQGEDLRACLHRFQNIGAWYEQHYSPSFMFSPASRTTATFYDEQGNALLTLQSGWTNKDVLPCYTTENGKAACLIHLLGKYLPNESASRNSTR